MPRTLAALLCALAAMPAIAADERAATPGASASPAAGEARVIHIDANTQIRVDPRLREVTGTDTAAAGASASMEERHRREMQMGAAGPDEVKSTLPPKPEKTKKPRR